MFVKFLINIQKDYIYIKYWYSIIYVKNCSDAQAYAEYTFSINKITEQGRKAEF